MTEVETFDQASLEAFTSGLVAAGFEPEPGTNQRFWKGPIHSAFDDLTDATRMRICLRDGWPFVFPVLFAEGLHTNHLTEDGFVCMWHEGVISDEWLTVEGFFGRIDDWCDKAKNGWDEAGLARDAYLNFTNKHAAVASYDLDGLQTDNQGSWGAFYATARTPLHLLLGPGTGNAGDLSGLWFHVGSVLVPPRNLDEVRDQLSSTQRKGLDRAIGQRRQGDVLARSGGVDLAMFRWDRGTNRHLLVLGLEGVNDEVNALALQDGPIDEQSLLLRAGRDAPVLRNKSVAIFGLGALGGHAAVCLASSGIGRVRLIDGDWLLPGNVVRHVSGHSAIGAAKVLAVEVAIRDHAPWTVVERVIERPRTPSRLAELMQDVDLVLDTTGTPAITAALASLSTSHGVPLVSAALYRAGRIARVQRQGTPGDVAIPARVTDDRYRLIPPGPEEEELAEPAVGCSAPVNNAPPASALACAGLLCEVAIDTLTERGDFPDEVTDVYRPLDGEPPYDQLGRVRDEDSAEPQEVAAAS